jgi:hypothetical protein
MLRQDLDGKNWEMAGVDPKQVFTETVGIGPQPGDGPVDAAIDAAGDPNSIANLKSDLIHGCLLTRMKSPANARDSLTRVAIITDPASEATAERNCASGQSP